MDQGFEGPTGYIHITQNEFSYRKHKKQKEEDIAICECKLDLSFPDTACGERCLNALTNTECTPGYCPSSTYCKNQKFQRCEYVKTRLFRTAGRGWGLLADQNIKAGDFVTEYCGEVISWREAKKRAQAYEIQGITDAYMIALNAFESIDATRKGSLARFINHSCEPNCETRKWTVLGENRVGIFAKQDISVGTELSYDYNFEWYGGAKIRCLCGGINCSGFLGAKSRGFQEDTYLWEDDDDRFSVEKIPLYDSAEDEAPESVLVTADSTKSGSNDAGRSDHSSVEGSYALPDREAVLAGKDPVISQLNNSQKKKVKSLPKGRVKNLNPKEVDARLVASLLAEKEAQEEVLNFEGIRIDASSNLESVYNEIRPTIEEHERDNQDSVPTSLAVKWIEACCYKSKAEFDLYCSIMKNIVCAPKRKRSDIEPAGVNENEVKLMTNG